MALRSPSSSWAPDSSSPASSPTTPWDSSPALSTRLDLDDPVEFTLPEAAFPVHPYAASARAWVPPDTEKGAKKARARLSRASPDPDEEFGNKRRRMEGPAEAEVTPFTPTPTPRPSVVTREDTELATWDKAASDAIDNGVGSIQLDNHDLQEIPIKFIEDLKAFHAPRDAPAQAGGVSPLSPLLGSARPFSRVKTAPAVMGLGSSRIAGEITLFLASNHISTVPRELFQLEKLTLLSLRNNALQYLHPDIRFLRNLHTLTVANNQLKYLPAELNQLSCLEHLHVFPNPFLEKAEMNAVEIRGKYLSPTRRILPRVPPLTELCLRTLFSSDQPVVNPSTAIANRRLAKFYELPLLEDGVIDKPLAPGKKRFQHRVPSTLRRTLEAIHPGSTYAYDDDEDASFGQDEEPELGVCISRAHPPSRPSVFVRPAEERYSWETIVAKLDIGGVAPLRWRGCMVGCLAFLGPQEPEEIVKEEDAIQRVQLASGGLELDFEDDG
ncbi:hypothetical protein HMN09_00961200 [Mycena chlorophos]|uniref:Leucine rich repeat domain protein n=1 Tax=Mycena chlorophos TaxID=658473 RepID=A0A8H6SKM1_MYCCL|nr:hypothetical protein HMN09_00961200 [Mycena chlorophos]